MRLKRLQKLVELGIINQSVVPHEVYLPAGGSEWADMSAEQRRLSSRAMETYAGEAHVTRNALDTMLIMLIRHGRYDRPKRGQDARLPEEHR